MAILNICSLLHFYVLRSFGVVCERLETKKAVIRQPFFRTEGRDRTGTSVTSSVFETDASTNSATSALID